jgi:hypothetical protein
MKNIIMKGCFEMKKNTALEQSPHFSQDGLGQGGLGQDGLGQGGLERGDLELLIERTAKRGARLALAELGLDDDHAPEDIRDLRLLLTSWRRIRRQTLETLLKLSVHLILAALLAVSTVLLWFSGR